MNYKKGDPVRVKADGSMWYFNKDINGSNADIMTGDPLIYPKKNYGCVKAYDEIEPLPLRHPYYGKMVLVNGTEERIFIDDRIDGVVAVQASDEEYFRNGKVYNTSIWDRWEPLPEQPPADQVPTPEELAAFEKVRSYFDRINKGE